MEGFGSWVLLGLGFGGVGGEGEGVAGRGLGVPGCSLWT